MALIKVLIACLAAILPANSNLFSPSDNLTIREIGDVKQPIEEVISTAGSSQCSKIKELLGMSYEQSKKPDLNQLKLKYIGRDDILSYNINEAAELIPQAPWFNPNQKLYIYAHGFSDNATTSERFRTIREALYKQGECNVLVLDCGCLLQMMYMRSSTNARFIGEKLGDVLAAMTKSGVDPAQIHMIGNSLGAHIVGFAGKGFAKDRNCKIGRITGLDPAKPCFSDVDDDLRLQVTDAEFVDVIHTNAGGYALEEPMGHVDYYPNGGHHQPGCLDIDCNHDRGWAYYAESVVNPDAFPAVKCDGWDAFKEGKTCSDEISYMGHPSSSKASGKYCLQTAGESPYGLGLDGIKYTNDEGLIMNTVAGTHSWG